MDGGIIVNADDFGLSQDSNRAVAMLARLGTISSTSVMINMPFAVEIESIVAEVPGLGVGLHVNLTQGRPLSPPDAVRSLTRDDGTFHPPRVLVKRALLGAVSMAEVRLELGAQIEALRARVGPRFDHWDSHQGIHRFEPLAGVIMSSCRDGGVGGMRSHRHLFLAEGQPGRPVRVSLGTLRQFGMGRLAKETYYAWLSRRGAERFAVPDGLLSPAGGTTASLLRILAHGLESSEVLEVPCHPAASVDGLSGTKLLRQRVEEYEVLSSREFQDACSSGSLRLLTFSRLVALREERKHAELAASAV